MRHRHPAIRPIIAFGNSTGDREMLEYTTAGNGARLGLLVLHDVRKYEESVKKYPNPLAPNITVFGRGG